MSNDNWPAAYPAHTLAACVANILHIFAWMFAALFRQWKRTSYHLRNDVDLRRADESVKRNVPAVEGNCISHLLQHSICYFTIITHSKQSTFQQLPAMWTWGGVEDVVRCVQAAFAKNCGAFWAYMRLVGVSEANAASPLFSKLLQLTKAEDGEFRFSRQWRHLNDYTFGIVCHDGNLHTNKTINFQWHMRTFITFLCLSHFYGIYLLKNQKHVNVSQYHRSQFQLYFLSNIGSHRWTGEWEPKNILTF